MTVAAHLALSLVSGTAATLYKHPLQVGAQVLCAYNGIVPCCVYHMPYTLIE